MLYMLRVTRTERFTNPATGQVSLKEAKLVKRAKARSHIVAALFEDIRGRVSGASFHGRS